MSNKAELNRSYLKLIHNARQEADRAFRKAMVSAGHQMTPRQYLALVAIRDAQPCTMVDIVKATGIDRSTTSDVLRRLSGRGWIKVVRNPEDRRAAVVTITESGEQILRVAARVETKTFSGRSLDTLAREAA